VKAKLEKAKNVLSSLMSMGNETFFSSLMYVGGDHPQSLPCTKLMLD
jgi:hypothetical protein